MQFILGVRRIRGEMNIAPGKPLPVLLSHATAQDRAWLEPNRQALGFIARLERSSAARRRRGTRVGDRAGRGMRLLIPLPG